MSSDEIGPPAYNIGLVGIFDRIAGFFGRVRRSRTGLYSPALQLHQPPADPAQKAGCGVSARAGDDPARNIPEPPAVQLCRLIG